MSSSSTSSAAPPASLSPLIPSFVHRCYDQYSYIVQFIWMELYRGPKKMEEGKSGILIPYVTADTQELTRMKAIGKDKNDPDPAHSGLFHRFNVYCLPCAERRPYEYQYTCSDSHVVHRCNQVDPIYAVEEINTDNKKRRRYNMNFFYDQTSLHAYMDEYHLNIHEEKTNVYALRIQCALCQTPTDLKDDYNVAKIYAKDMKRPHEFLTPASFLLGHLEYYMRMTCTDTNIQVRWRVPGEEKSRLYTSGSWVGVWTSYKTALLLYYTYKRHGDISVYNYVYVGEGLFTFELHEPIVDFFGFMGTRRPESLAVTSNHTLLRFRTGGADIQSYSLDSAPTLSKALWESCDSIPAKSAEEEAVYLRIMNPNVGLQDSHSFEPFAPNESYNPKKQKPFPYTVS